MFHKKIGVTLRAHCTHPNKYQRLDCGNKTQRWKYWQNMKLDPCKRQTPFTLRVIGIWRRRTRMQILPRLIHKSRRSESAVVTYGRKVSEYNSSLIRKEVICILLKKLQMEMTQRPKNCMESGFPSYFCLLIVLCVFLLL